MALSTKQQISYWGAGFAALLLVFYFLSSVLTPFLVGAFLAYCLDPVADRLEAMGLSRLLATALITVCALVIFLVAMIVAIPFLTMQAIAFFESVPGIVDAFRKFLETRFPSLFDKESAIWQGLQTAPQNIKQAGLAALNTVVSSSLALLDILILLVVAPVVAFYMLLDWDKMVAKIDTWLPRDHRDTVRSLASSIDKALNAFLRGQLAVMMFLAAFYAFGLMLIGLDFGAFVGIFAGLISFIPFVGSILGGSVALGLAVFQFWGEWWLILAVLAVFGVGQFIEGNILTPKFVGNSVGLHPVTLMFALSAFGALFGFFGLLIAVPLAAAIGVLVRFGLSHYLEGRLYQGVAGRDEDT